MLGTRQHVAPDGLAFSLWTAHHCRLQVERVARRRASGRVVEDAPHGARTLRGAANQMAAEDTKVSATQSQKAWSYAPSRSYIAPATKGPAAPPASEASDSEPKIDP